MLEGELAATAWLLLDGRVPLVVASDDDRPGAAALLRSLVDLLPNDVARVELAGDEETFDWLPQATELGWPGVGHAPVGGTPIRPAGTVLVADLSDRAPTSTWGEAARVAVRAASIGYGLAVTMSADSLDAVLESLRAMPVRLTDDELTRLGVVLVVRRADGRSRVVAAHYLRPVARDAHGHVQRLGPGVLATWDPAAELFEDFGWGFGPELAARIGMRPGDFEQEVAARRALLDGLVAAGTVDPAAIHAAVDRHRAAAALAATNAPSTIAAPLPN
jgi:hypothetical protein